MGALEATSAGRVTLVGAGPGDPELLTLKALRAIAAADVILVDDLVHADVLAHARQASDSAAAARIVHVGKRGGCASTPQAFIEKLMIAEAARGMHVVRLKGGDPFVFGRGGEECASLRAAGIAVDVVHGISSGLAAPGSVGIPLTHRDYSQGVIFVTGHRRADAGQDGRAGDVNWTALAATGLTLVIYMGVAHCAEICAALMAGGMSASTPAAAIQSASHAAQRQVVTTVSALPDALLREGLGSPAILVIGDVVRCADPAFLAGAGDLPPLMLAGSPLA